MDALARSKNKNLQSYITFSLPKKVGIIYSEVKREYFPTESQYLTEKDSQSDAEITATYLNNLGVKTFLYPGDSNLPKNLAVLSDNGCQSYSIIQYAII